MTRSGVLLLIILCGARVYAQPVATSPGFDPLLVNRVFAVSLAFMVPRILEPVPISQLTVWGLRGLTALDPELIAELREGALRLSAGSRLVGAVPAPQGESADAWAAAAVQLSAQAAAASPAIRRSGSRGIVQSFFDELFNHLDPYSRYVPPEEARQDQERRRGRAGLGLSLIQHGSAIVVQAAIRDGPAALAGMRVGDTILRVDGEPVRGMDASAVSRLIEGPEDTRVRLTWRGRDKRMRNTEFSRALVPPETVFANRLGDVLVVRLTAFSYSTSAHLAHALQDGFAKASKPSGVLLDLRGNRGGVLREAVTAADTLLPAGVVAYTVGRDPAANHIWRSEEGEIAEHVPVVVTVDGRTASAAEVLAAALADRGRAVVVGSSTLGKGLVQTVTTLPDGGELFVTWSRILAPGGWPIQGLGVLPQVCTSVGEEALRRELAALASGVQPMAPALELHRAARAPLPPAEALAIRDACPAAEGRVADAEAALELVRNPESYAAALLPPLREAPVR